MTPAEAQSLSDAVVNILISHAAHGLATGTLAGTGEITLRDGLIVAAASVAAKRREAWIFDREYLPAGWQDAKVDLVILRKGLHNDHPVAGIELKWWRSIDAANAGNRRKELLRDFFRAAALYWGISGPAFVALVSTAGSWTATANTSGTDQIPMKMLNSSATEHWNTSLMAGSSAIRAAMASLKGKVPVCNIFHTKLLSECSISLAGNQTAFSKVWEVKKPQNTRFLTDAEIDYFIA